MKYPNWFPLAACGLATLAAVVPLAAQTPPVPNSSLVLVFKSDAPAFTGFKLDGAPFAAPGLSAEFGSIWPAPAGKHEFSIGAQGAEEKTFEITAPAGQVGLLVLGLTKNPDAKKAAEFPKAITLASIPLTLPSPKGKVLIFAYTLAEVGPAKVEVIRGNTAGVPVLLEPRKLIPLGEGSCSVMAGDSLLMAAHHGTPGVYVYIVSNDSTGELQAVPFSIVVETPEEP